MRIILQQDATIKPQEKRYEDTLDNILHLKRLKMKLQPLNKTSMDFSNILHKSKDK